MNRPEMRIRTGKDQGIRRVSGFPRAFSSLFIVSAFVLISSPGLRADYILVTPASPNVEQEASFRWFQTGPEVIFGLINIVWNFGDGTTATANISATVSHAYSSPGSYIVRAIPPKGMGAADLTTTVIVEERRRLEFTPPNPLAGQSISLAAVNFLSGSVQWDFGDGQTVLGSTKLTHTYQSGGTYTVVARDLGGASKVPISVQIQVTNPMSITFTPAKPRLSEQVEFTAVNFSSKTLIRWDFGDGTIENDPTPPKALHVFNKAGTYLVRAYDGGGAAVSAAVTVIVYPQGSIGVAPADPRAGEPVVLTALDFFSKTLIRWDFGDGTIENDPTPPVTTHIYNNSGTYLVRAYDDGGTAVTASRYVQIWPERLITFNPPYPRVEENIVFRAVNFASSSILWDFGDGTVAPGGTQVTHKYLKTGPFAVTAYDSRGTTQIPVKTSLAVLLQSGPRAPFKISYIHLRFKDGKAYKVVRRYEEAFEAFAEIKYEGTGILYAQWLLDGMPFRLVTGSLPFAQQTVLESGRTPGLPTLVPGLHEITLNVIRPETEFRIPAIRYFVTADTVEPQAVDLRLESAKSLGNLSFALREDSVEVPTAEYFLLEGKIKNETASGMAFALLRIFLGNDMVDQKILQRLNPGEERRFVSSIHNTTAEGGKIYIAFYDVSRKPARLLYLRELSLVTKK